MKGQVTKNGGTGDRTWNKKQELVERQATKNSDRVTGQVTKNGEAGDRTGDKNRP